MVVEKENNYINDPAKQNVDWDKVNVNNSKQIYLYNVQAEDIFTRVFNNFIYAYSEDDAIDIMIKKYKNTKFDRDDIYCQKVDIRRGMIFKK